MKLFVIVNTVNIIFLWCRMYSSPVRVYWCLKMAPFVYKCIQWPLTFRFHASIIIHWLITGAVFEWNMSKHSIFWCINILLIILWNYLRYVLDFKLADFNHFECMHLHFGWLFSWMESKFTTSKSNMWQHNARRYRSD